MKQTLTITPLMNAKRSETLTDTFQKEKKRLFEFIRRRVPERTDAEDILQDVFYQLSATVEPIEQVTSWLFRVARNKIIDKYRKKKTESLEKHFQGEGDDESIFLNYADLITDPHDNPEQIYIQSLIREALSEALAELPEEQQKVFVLHEMEGKSFKEISELTGDSVNTLLSRKRYAVLFLRERLQNLYNDLFN